jgi:regulator of replication initiation timing
MRWFANLFATRRELTRLARELKDSRAEVASLKVENKSLLVRNDKLVDRMLTAQLKTFAISDEVRRIADPQVKEGEAKERNQMLNVYLADEYSRFVSDAIDAGRPVSDAEALFNQRKPELTEEFNSQFGFN